MNKTGKPNSAPWDGIERRRGGERRKQERRRSTRYTADLLIVIDGVTWVDNEGMDRRRRVRRRADRELLARKVFEALKD